MTPLMFPRSVGLGLVVILLMLSQLHGERILFFLMPLFVPCSPHLVMLKVITEMAERGHDVKVNHKRNIRIFLCF